MSSTKAEPLLANWKKIKEQFLFNPTDQSCDMTIKKSGDGRKEIEFLRSNLVINGSEWDGKQEKGQHYSTLKIGSRQKFGMNYC